MPFFLSATALTTSGVQVFTYTHTDIINADNLILNLEITPNTANNYGGSIYFETLFLPANDSGISRYLAGSQTATLQYSAAVNNDTITVTVNQPTYGAFNFRILGLIRIQNI